MSLRKPPSRRRETFGIDRLAVTSNGQVRYDLQTPHRNGTPDILFELLDFIAKLAALVP